jgi:hypothetical protein
MLQTLMEPGPPDVAAAIGRGAFTTPGRSLSSISIVALISTLLAPFAHGQCQPKWSSGLGFPGTNGPVSAAISWDPDGGGGESAMAVVAGSFSIAGEAFASNIAAWDGEQWNSLGDGIPGSNTSIRALAVFDEGGAEGPDAAGAGPALYAGGFFNTANGAPANYIARWDGATWTPVGGGLNGQVFALAVFDDGSGPALYAGGAFVNAGGQPAQFIARWDGASWSSVGGGMDNWVLTLAVFDDGSGDGPALHAGGQFIIAGGVLAPFAARWNGQFWSDLDTGEIDGVIHAMTVYDDGDGTDLYAAGEFTLVGTLAVANFIARWDGSTWSALGAGTDDTINTLAVFDDGEPGSPALYAGGGFTSAGIVSANRIARWDGSDWSAPGSGVNSTVTALAVVDDAAASGADSRTSSSDFQGPIGALYVGGQFSAADSIAARHIARWDGSAWSSLGDGAGLNAGVNAFAIFDDGSGPALHAAGGFTTAGGGLANHVARWDAQNEPAAWFALGGGTNFAIQALSASSEAESGGGSVLYAGGWFTTADGAPANYIAQWDGAAWSPLGSGVSYIVRALAVFDDPSGAGAGPALYVGGGFQLAGGDAANFIARWDGSQWSPLSSGVNNYVYAITSFDDGSGPALYAAGEFTAAGGEPANSIARWDGKTWSPLGSGLNSAVYALATFDSALYAGGFFATAGGQPANCIARWNGTSWEALGDGLAGGAFPAVFVLAVFDDGTGSGPALYAGGQFTTAGGVPANGVARWDGSTWSSLSTGVEGTSAPAVYALQVVDESGSTARKDSTANATGSSALYVGGAFHVAGGVVSAYWARWGCPSCPADLFPAHGGGGGGGDGIVGPDDLAWLLAAWGDSNSPGDLNSDGDVGPDDLAILLASWGPCRR